MTTAEDLPAVFRMARNTPALFLFDDNHGEIGDRAVRLANALLDVAAWLDCRETVADWRKAAEIRALVARA